MPGIRACVLGAVVFVLDPVPARAASESVAAQLARQARAECEAGRGATGREVRRSHFERGQALAERAVRADDRLAEAHFGIFCNMGELMRLDGESVSSILALRRLMAALDRTLALDPMHADALGAKGTLLVRLPRLLGGDAVQGEELLRLSVRYDPTAYSSRLMLARTCGARGDRGEAEAFTRRALEIARQQGRADRIAEAQAVLAELDAAR
jgi:hypothetical protein